LPYPAIYEYYFSLCSCFSYARPRIFWNREKPVLTCHLSPHPDEGQAHLEPDPRLYLD